MALTVRRAAERDLEVVGRLTVQAYLDDELVHENDAYLDELAAAARRVAQAELWVAEDDSGVVGTVTYCTAGTELAELAGPGEGEFRMLAVTRDARRRGVAETLVRHCIDRSRELGLATLVLSSKPEMRTAHRLYERLGFRRTPERDWSPVPGVDLLAFRLDLS